jgi:hypothetical protein
MPHVLVRDIETVPDLVGFAAANGHEGKTEDEIPAELGDKFSQHIYHSIICIGALIAPVPPVPLLDGFRDAFLASALEVLFFEASRFAVRPDFFKDTRSRAAGLPIRLTENEFPLRSLALPQWGHRVS